jgi:hypothetical protein
MTNDKKPRFWDRNRINVEEEWEVSDWADSLNTTPAKIMEAVEAVGDETEKVVAYVLERKRRFDKT